MFNRRDNSPDIALDQPFPAAAGVVVKPPLDDATDCRGREAERLARLHHRGIVELVEAISGPHGTTIHLAEVPNATTLERTEPLRLAELLDVATQLAEAIAYLHSTNTAHNALAADHILLGDQNRLVLCGFGHWCELTSENSCVDIVAFGDVLTGELDRSLESGLFTTEDTLVTSLRHLGQLASNCDLTETTAQSLAERFGHLQADSASGSASRSPLPDTFIAAGRIAGGVAIGALVVASAWSLLRPTQTLAPAPDDETATPIAGVSSPAPTSLDPSSSQPSTTIGQGDAASTGELIAATEQTCPAVTPVWNDPNSNDKPDSGWLDLDDDGCPDPWRYTNGILHTIEGRFAVGQPGDHLSLGDWNCDGVPTPAVASGDLIYIFDSAPSSIELGSKATAKMVAEIPGIISLDVRPDGRCDELIITDTQGSPTVLTQATMQGLDQ